MGISNSFCRRGYTFILFSIMCVLSSSFLFAQTLPAPNKDLEKEDLKSEVELSDEEDVAKSAGAETDILDSNEVSGSSALPLKKNAKKKDVNYKFSILSDGSIEFKQFLQWENLFGVLYYELTVREKESEKVVVDRLRTKKNTAELSLSPGSYEYKVDAYNMLSQRETSSEWAKIEVKQAHNPKIESLRPGTIWIEDEKWNLKVYGSDFAPDSEVAFVSDGIFRRTLKIPPKEKTDKHMLFHFNKPESLLGIPYRVWIKDPSGIENISSPFIVKYKRPVSFYCGLGYAPIAPFGDAFYKTHWNSPVYPVSFVGTVGLIFSRKSYGYFGISSKNTVRTITLKHDDTILKNHVFISTFNFVYEWWFIRKLSLYASGGFGLAVNKLSFFYLDAKSEEIVVVDPTYSVSLGLRAKLHRFVYMDVVFRFEQLLNNDIKPMFITPEIAVGFRY